METDTLKEAVAKFKAWCDHHINVDSWAELNAAVRSCMRAAAIAADEEGGDWVEAEIDRLLPKVGGEAWH